MTATHWNDERRIESFKWQFELQGIEKIYGSKIGNEMQLSNDMVFNDFQMGF